MRILDEKQIKQKIRRLAYQIAEQNYNAEEIILMGINNNGYSFAKLIHKEIKKVAQQKLSLHNIRLNPAHPLEEDVTIEKSLPLTLDNKAIVLIDDVANTGRTIFYAFKPLLSLLPYKIEVAVLVNRQHKLFPIQVDYVGLSLATTLKENIQVKIKDVDNMEVYLT